MKILTIVGARPQFIKAATISRLVSNRPDVSEVFVHTGQHYDEEMSQIFFDNLDIPVPDYNLGVGSASHGVQTGRMLAAVEEVAQEEAPDVALVHGDTNSTLAGAVACTKLHIPVAHVEAGLRSFNRKMPEEINRILTDHASDLLFAPTEQAAENLRGEGLEERTRQVGDVMYDAALYYREKVEDRDVEEPFDLESESYTLVTVHRAENTDQPERLLNIFEGLRRAAAHRRIVLPLHPRTKKALDRRDKLDDYSDALMLIDPVGYLSMVRLEQQAELIVTDSGGVQKEAYYHRIPCVTLRDETEWTELVQAGWNRLVPPVSIQSVYNGIMNPPRGKEGENRTLYGDGSSAQKIIKCLLDYSQTVS